MTIGVAHREWEGLKTPFSFISAITFSTTLNLCSEMHLGAISLVCCHLHISHALPN